MPFGLLAGFGAALAWGTLDIITALASRVIGSLRVTTGIQIVGAAEFARLGLVTGAVLPLEPRRSRSRRSSGSSARPRTSRTSPACRSDRSRWSAGWSPRTGASPSSSRCDPGRDADDGPGGGCSGRDRRRDPDRDRVRGRLRSTRFAGPGVVFAVVALVMFAAMSIVTDIALDTIDWLPLMIMARGVQRDPVGRDPGGPGPSWRASAERPADAPSWSRTKVALAIVVAGTLDVLGLISFVIGLETRADLDGRARLVVRPGGDDHRGGGVPRRTPQAASSGWGSAGILVGMIAIGLPTS